MSEICAHAASRRCTSACAIAWASARLPTVVTTAIGVMSVAGRCIMTTQRRVATTIRRPRRARRRSGVQRAALSSRCCAARWRINSSISSMSASMVSSGTRTLSASTSLSRPRGSPSVSSMKRHGQAGDARFDELCVAHVAQHHHLLAQAAEPQAVGEHRDRRMVAREQPCRHHEDRRSAQPQQAPRTAARASATATATSASSAAARPPAARRAGAAATEPGESSRDGSRPWFEFRGGCGPHCAGVALPVRTDQCDA